MVIDDLRQVNRLWKGIYPYLASQIMESFQKDTGLVLELGSFSGGISLALSRLHPDLQFTIANESLRLNNRLGRERVTMEELEELVSNSNLPDTWEIEQEGGLWVKIRKERT